MSLSLFVENFIDALKFESLIILADILKVPHNEEQWFDDEWLDKEDDLRVVVGEAMFNAKIWRPEK